MNKSDKLKSRIESTDINESDLMELTRDLIKEGADKPNIQQMLDSEEVSNELAPFIKSIVSLTEIIPQHVSKIQEEYKELININDISKLLEELLMVLFLTSLISDKKLRRDIVSLPTNEEAKAKEAEKISKKINTNLIPKDLIAESVKLEFDFDLLHDVIDTSLLKEIIKITSISSNYFEYLFYLEMKKAVSLEAKHYWKPLIEILKYTKNQFPTFFNINVSLSYSDRKIVKTRFIDFEKSFINARNKLELQKK
jgi:hypothetical protein